MSERREPPVPQVFAIRPAVRGDLDRIVAAVVRLSENGTVADPRYRLVDGAAPRLRAWFADEWFGRFLPFPACLLAERDGALVGLVTAALPAPHPVVAQGPTMCIDNLWVEPAYRRHGLGRQLVDDMRQRAQNAGYTRQVVSTLANDDRAVAFWRAVGFSPLTVTLEAE